MNKKIIPDLAYEVDGDTVTIEQGWSEPVSVVLHKIHLKHLVQEMGVDVDGSVGGYLQLDSHLRVINDIANELYQMINSVPTYPPSADMTEDLSLAHNLVKKTELALALWGDS